MTNIKNYLLLIFCSSSILISSCNTSNDGLEVAEETFTIRVLTYNIFHGETTNGEIDMDLFAEIINNQSPDLVALQEVDKNTTRVGGVDITAELSERTGLEGFFGKFRDYRGGEYGAAILSKYPVVDFQVKQAYVSTGVIRSLLYAKAQISDDKYIFFNSSHLSNIYEERAAQTEELVSYYENEIDKAPLLICGDLNAEPESPEMKGILEQFAMSDTTLGFTFSTRTGMRKKIDFVLYPDNDNWKVLETKRICRADASDHCALLSVLEYRK